MKTPAYVAHVAPMTHATPPSELAGLDFAEAAQRLREREGPADAERTPRVAVLVAHGMGQQVPFETVDGIADALMRVQAMRGTAPAGVDVRQVQSGGERFARVEMRLAPKGREPRETHLYEAYWAPLTEGSIGSLETFLFLMDAAGNGIRAATRGHFHRFMFDSWQCFHLGWRTVMGFAIAACVLLSLFLMNAIVAGVALGRILSKSATAWPREDTVGALGVDLLLYLAAVVLLVSLGVVLPGLLRRPAAGGGHRGAPAWLSGLGNGLATAAAIATMVAGVVMLLHASGHARFVPPDAGPWSRQGWLWEWFSLESGSFRSWWQGSSAAGLWIALLFASHKVRWFLRQYVGDVAVYVSSYRVDRFARIRDEIKAAVMKVTRFVYDLREPQTGRPYYDRIVIVGHSLGSVVAYDALNGMIREDLSRPDAALAGAGEPAAPFGDVVARTTALVTYGSPLDKVALLFRQQLKRDSIVREGLAAAMQPLIQSYDFRPARWVNVWTPRDWISGDLDFYDPSNEARTDPRRVHNIVDHDATTPLAAHTEYVSGRLLPRLLYREVTR